MASPSSDPSTPATVAGRAARLLLWLTLISAGLLVVLSGIGLLSGIPAGNGVSDPTPATARALRGAEIFLASIPLVALIRLSLLLRRESPRSAMLALGALLVTLVGIVVAS